MRYFQLILKDIFAKSPQSLKPLLIILMLPNDIDGVALTQYNFIYQNILQSIIALISTQLVIIFLYAIPLLLLAFHASALKNSDIDKPSNLAKSVTVE